jgi:outer membrane protein assembly factor BamB
LNVAVVRVLLLSVAGFPGGAVLGQDKPQATGAVAPTIEEVRRLVAQEKFRDASLAAERLLESQTENPTSWVIRGLPQKQIECWLGEKYGYVFEVGGAYWGVNAEKELRTLGVPATDPAASGREVGNSGKVEGRSELAVTCVELATGRMLWVRRFIGMPQVGVCGADDSVWIWDLESKAYTQLAAATGEVAARGQLPSTVGPKYEIDGLLVGRNEVRLWSGRLEHVDRDNRLMVDLTSNSFRELDRYGALAPGGLNLLRPMSPGVAFGCYAVGVDKPVWTLSWEFGEVVASQWVGQDVVAVTSPGNGKWRLFKLDGKSGTPIWETNLPSAPGTMDWRVSGRYGKAFGEAVGRLGSAMWVRGKEVFLLTSDLQVQVYNGDSGKLLRTVKAPARLAGMPAGLPDGSIVFVTADGRMRRMGARVGDDSAVTRATRMEAFAILYKAKVRTGEVGIDAIHGALKEAKTAEDYRILAAAARDVGDKGLITGLLTRALDVGNQTEDVELKEKFGLIARLPTGPVSGGVAVDGGRVLVSDESGFVRVFDVAGAKQEAVEPVRPGSIDWELRGKKLQSPYMAKPAWELADPQAIEAGDPLEPRPPRSLLTSTNAKEITDEQRRRANLFNSRSHFDSRRLGGRDMYGLQGGGVMEVTPTDIVERPALVRIDSDWRWDFLGERVVVIGAGNVYSVDEHFRAKEVLWRQRSSGSGKVSGTGIMDSSQLGVSEVCSDGKTVALAGVNRAIVAQDGLRMAQVAVWNADIQVPLRTAEFTGSVKRGGLVRLGGAYVAAGTELVVIPDDPSVPVWRYRAIPVEPKRVGDLQTRGGMFGVPRLVGDRVVVAHSEGGVYIFDAKKMGLVK